MLSRALLACLCVFVAPLGAVTPRQIDPFIAGGGVRDVKISPDGRHYAMAVHLEGETALMVRTTDNAKVIAAMRFGRDTHVHQFWWVNNDRLLMALAETFGTRDQPVATGELYAVNANGSQRQLLVGYRATGAPMGSRISAKREDPVAATLVDLLPGDDKNVLVAVRPFTGDAHSHVERLNVYDGRRVRVASAPVLEADYVADHQGRVRFAWGRLGDNHSQLFHRKDDASPWEQVNHERDSGRLVIPLGLASDDRRAYLRVSQPSGPDRVVEMDTATGQRRDLAFDAIIDPQPIHDPADGAPVGALFLGARPRTAFFDEQGDEARLQQTLQRAFPDALVSMRSASRDGRLRVVLVQSDVDPGSFYLFDSKTRHADMIVARDQEIDVEAMSKRLPVALRARDGTELHGFLTMPRAGASPAPMVVLPHGGPFGIFDSWLFDNEAQLLASHGYAVLQVNFRGSGNYGRSFRQAGARQWGLAMQDDVTDATRWAIEQGHADPGRICIYGASYGAYAAMMGAAREPGLYRCAAGYVGVYDLPRMQRGDARVARSLAIWSREWVGDDVAKLAQASPVNLAGQIQVPVLLAAGGKDLVAPVEHTRGMEAALKRAGVPVETLYYPNEGHGFYEVSHRREFYRRLLDFLGRHIGTAGG